MSKEKTHSKIDMAKEIKEYSYPNEIIHFHSDGNKAYFKTENEVILEITVIKDDNIQFRYATDGLFEHVFSYAVSKDVGRNNQQLEIKETEKAYSIKTSILEVLVHKKNSKIKILDVKGNTINEDDIGFHWTEKSRNQDRKVGMSKTSLSNENFYGGDKATSNNLKGKYLINWATEFPDGFHNGQEPLYKTIPFYIGLREGCAYGIFFDNTFASHFDFSNTQKDITKFWAEGGEMNYYFFYGPKISNVVEAYTVLTGTPELPPLWSLGFHQCKWSYYPESKVKEIAKTFRKLRIPCDAIYLDIDYQDGFRSFTWDESKFPDPKRMVSDLYKDGFKTVAIIDPAIKIDEDYWVYREGIANGHFCKLEDGSFVKAKVWPGDCNFPDYTNPKVRDWWAELHKEIVGNVGVKGIWNDMTEPAAMEDETKTLPLSVRHDYDGRPCSHRKAHNVYGTQMVRATFNGMKKYSHPDRPFILGRSAYAGAQRYIATWTGDNFSTWEHLTIANNQVQRMGISGMSFVGSDIGGFSGQPSGELFIRWIQLGVFHPYFRVHSRGDHGDQEPWCFDKDTTDIVRYFIELRYQLLPYLYTAFWKYANYGTPMIKPLVYYDQEDIQTHERDDEFVFGEQILVCPILESAVSGRKVYIPKGRWFNIWTEEIMVGGKESWVDVGIDEIPLFVKEGAIIPKYPVQQYVGEKKITELTLEVYFKVGSENSHLYEDEQDGYNHENGSYSYRTFQLHGRENELHIDQLIDGDYVVPYDFFNLNLHGLPFEVAKILVDNEEKTLDEVKLKENNTIKIASNFSKLYIISKSK